MNHPTRRMDVGALFRALDAEREIHGMTWTAVGMATGTPTGLFSRMRVGHAPSFDAYVAVVEWLGCSADRFIRSDKEQIRQDGGSGNETLQAGQPVPPVENRPAVEGVSAPEPVAVQVYGSHNHYGLRHLHWYRIGDGHTHG